MMMRGEIAAGSGACEWQRLVVANIIMMKLLFYNIIS